MFSSEIRPRHSNQRALESAFVPGGSNSDKYPHSRRGSNGVPPWDQRSQQNRFVPREELIIFGKPVQVAGIQSPAQDTDTSVQGPPLANTLFMQAVNPQPKSVPTVQLDLSLYPEDREPPSTSTPEIIPTHSFSDDGKKHRISRFGIMGTTIVAFLLGLRSDKPPQSTLRNALNGQKTDATLTDEGKGFSGLASLSQGELQQEKDCKYGIHYENHTYMNNDGEIVTEPFPECNLPQDSSLSNNTIEVESATQPSPTPTPKPISAESAGQNSPEQQPDIQVDELFTPGFIDSLKRAGLIEISLLVSLAGIYVAVQMHIGKYIGYIMHPRNTIDQSFFEKLSQATGGNPHRMTDSVVLEIAEDINRKSGGIYKSQVKELREKEAKSRRKNAQQNERYDRQWYFTEIETMIANHDLAGLIQLGNRRDVPSADIHKSINDAIKEERQRERSNKRSRRSSSDTWDPKNPEKLV